MGCGWLGEPLAVALVRQGVPVRGTTTHAPKAEILESQGIDPFVIQLGPEGFEGPWESFFEGLDTLVFNIPPGLRRNPERNYPARIRHLYAALERFKTPRLIYVSSTSVFGSHQGRVDESTTPQPDTESGKQLLEAESLLGSLPDCKVLTIRFGGLYGPGRHPAAYLAGRTGLQGGADPVNLIHLEDCLGILQEAFGDPDWTGVVHGVHPEHPPKAVYYARVAWELGLQPPVYEDDGGPAGNSKCIDSTVLPNRGYTWRHALG